jgi:hypothetical protein
MSISPYSLGVGALFALVLLTTDLSFMAGALLSLAAVAGSEIVRHVYAEHWRRDAAMTEAERAEDFDSRAM